MSDAMDLPKAEIVQIVSDWMQEYADALGVANDSDQIGLAIEELQADRDRLAARVEELEAALACARKAALEDAARIAETEPEYPSLMAEIESEDAVTGVWNILSKYPTKDLAVQCILLSCRETKAGIATRIRALQPDGARS